MEDDNNTASKLMNDENIKEILRNCEKAINEASGYNDTTDKLLDYITNLQQENQELNDSVTWWNNRFNAVQRDYEDYKSRIDEAVEYIQNHQLVFELSSKKVISQWFDMFYKDTLNILNGRSDE